ncbi:uncharacterized protein LOC9317972 isoform X3 [Arabidopsis lyrata subsp. lyrata]|uniref:uncharacterized protein LOC9317972 isoform X3 n=1 Tax=Arabidopsis lyrata subsp. lyrata TaxID=81972 RepID=UPI000A29C47A|nr:uncharacterized protein LOC9317972 isoform X3 [Arabidopsis lyrata subsp. lyrata]|eukprot:XP_020884209.1 uncharacterized protein LOC9317972 isoform X3 [Arabidopsis lyrata subsp. lyrata]
MDRLRDCLEEMVKFTLDCRVEFDLELTDDFCFGLLCGESILLDGERIESSSHALLHRFGGVPDYPLYKLLALGLLKSIDSGSVCGTFENISLGKEVIWLKEREDEWSKLINQKGSELVNALTDVACELHVQEPLSSLMKDGIKTVEARCFEAEYDRIRPRGSMVMINKCLMFEVMEVHQYPFFYELLKGESSEKVFPGTKTVEEGMQMFRKLYDMDQENSNGVVAINLSKSVVQPCVALAHILSGLSYTGVQNLLGLSHTTGSIFHALPPPRSMLLSSFMLPYKPKIKGCRLSHGARALAKHVDRSSDGFWGVLQGSVFFFLFSDSDKNKCAMKIINRFIGHCCWMNVHIVPPHGEVFEIRVAQGFGARWSRDGTKFIGFLEPYMEDGHSMAWKH